MDLTDLAVLSAVAAVGAWPLLRKALSALRSFRPVKYEAGDEVEQWRQKWTYYLITLGREIEAGEGAVANKQQALMLSKELMWEIIGGDSPIPKSGT